MCKNNFFSPKKLKALLSYKTHVIYYNSMLKIIQTSFFHEKLDQKLPRAYSKIGVCNIKNF